MLSGRVVTRLLAVIFLSAVLVFQAGQAIADSPAAPVYVNKMISVVQTPAVLPHGTGVFVMNMTNPYDNMTMENVSFTIGIYAYATLDDYIPLEDIEHPPLLYNETAGRGTELSFLWSSLQPGENITIHVEIEMQDGSPHGSVFNQASYFLRMKMNFTAGNGSYLLISRGYMSENAKNFFEGYHGLINSTVLQGFGFDGIIPDSSFAVRVPIPKWPFYALVGLAGLFAIGALFSYVEDNPGAFPAVERRYLWLKGKYRWMRRRWKRT